MRTMSAAVCCGLVLWLGSSGCEEGVKGSSCSVEEDANGVAVVCEDGSRATIPRAGVLPDGGTVNACTVTRDATVVTIQCADGSRVTLPAASFGLDGGAPSCAVSEADDGTISIACPDGTHATLPGDAPSSLLVGATTAACGTCHDSTQAKAHIAIMTGASDAGPVETCATCHSETGIAPVSRIHTRAEFGAPGLRVQLLTASVDPTSRKPTVRLQITDTAGNTVARDGMSISFVLSRVEPITPASGGAPIPGPQRNYLTRSATQMDTPAYPLDGGAPRTVLQPNTENATAGTFTAVSAGVYDYTFAYALPADYDATATHVIGLFATRTVSGVRFVSNATHAFVPGDAAATPQTRAIVRTETCNGCHNPLAFHGGARQELKLCVNCHTQGALDPESGHTIDFNVMVHKIHMGRRLPSVVEGGRFRLIGNGLSVYDWSNVGFPRPIENCQTCHTANDGDRWITNGVREACVACHENVDKPAAQGGHSMAIAPNSTCGSADCHAPSGEARDALAAHVSRLNTPTTPVFALELVSVTVDGLDQAPRVRFRARIGTTASGATDPVGSVDALSMLEVFVNGPNTGFALNGHDLVRVGKAQLVGFAPADVPGEFTFTLPKSFRELVAGAGDPASDSYTLSLRGQYDPTPAAAPDDDRVDMLQNPSAPFALRQPSARRAVVQTEKCNGCHGSLSAHSGAELATSVEQCAMCHTSTLDTRVRQAASGVTGPTTSLRLVTLVHRIHGDAIADAPYRVFGERAAGAPYPARDLSQVAFPGDVRDCSTCHANGTNVLPLPGLALPTRTVVLNADGGLTGR